MPKNINGAKNHVRLYSEYLCNLLKEAFVTNIRKMYFVSADGKPSHFVFKLHFCS